MITISAFEWVPDFAQGQVRDLRARWALEEAGLRYEVRLVSFQAMKEPAHLALHPFGQIPTYEEGELALFESGAIVLRIAERHSGLLPTHPEARSRAIMWMFAALNTIEPPIVDHDVVEYMEAGKSWQAARALLPAEVEVLPFVMKGKVEFALIRDVDGCVQWPWKVASA